MPVTGRTRVSGVDGINGHQEHLIDWFEGQQDSSAFKVVLNNCLLVISSR